MSWSQELAAAKRELKTLFSRALAQIFVYTLTANASAIGDKDAVEASDDGSLPGSTEEKPQRAVVRILPYGFRSRQPKGLRALTLKLGDSNLLFIGIAPTKATGPQGLDIGETALYCSADGTQVYLDKNGGVTVTDKGGAQVKLDGTGAVNVSAAAGANVNVTASGSGSVSVSATAVTGSVKLGPVGALQVLVLGAQDPVFGAPILQAPAAVASIVKAG